MARRVLIALMCSLAFAAPSIVRADDSDTAGGTTAAVVDCSAACPDGQVQTSYLDGQQVDCLCLSAGPGMIDDTNVQYDGTGTENPGNSPSGS